MEGMVWTTDEAKTEEEKTEKESVSVDPMFLNFGKDKILGVGDAA